MTLPFVPEPYPSEWIGFWLHRVAAVYGIDLPSLFVEINAVDQKEHPMTWGQIEYLTLDTIIELSRKLNISRSILKSMQRLISTRMRYAQVGCCPLCLINDGESDRQMYWRNQWMDPYYGWCSDHQKRLVAVDSKDIRRLRTDAQTDRFFSNLIDNTRDDLSWETTANLDQACSIIKLQTVLHKEVNRSKLSYALPLRMIVDRIAHHGLANATELNSMSVHLMLPLANEVISTRKDSFVGYLATMKRFDQRAEALRLAAIVLWPSHDEQVIREEIWRQLPDRSRNEMALDLKDAKLRGTGMKWDAVRVRAKTAVRRSILPMFSGPDFP